MSSIEDIVEWNKAHNDTTGALGNSTWWWDTTSGQTFYDAAVATNGTQGEAFWTAFGFGRFTARQAVDTAHVHKTDNGTFVELDGLLIPNGRAGGYSSACAPIPSYAGYPIAAVPIGLDAYSTPYGMCVYGRQWGEAKLVKVASAMEDLFQWNEKPQWYNIGNAERPWEAPFPGYTCSPDSLERYTCEPAAAA